MSGELKELCERMARMETKTEERWLSHDKNSEERHADTKDHFKKLYLWLEQLPCKTREGMYKQVEGMEKRIGFLQWAIGIILLICGWNTVHK